ncbi:TPA: hypothetical protein RHI59_003122 [Acinetobacter baumannii]|uniref:hypothetical protein n=1 Tax=Acinetobacter baumannii TaxID=470 RepID=UPI00165F9F0C|nr:hypothetical protein [Acinetobacter baumannii]EHU1845173.1 hypothetical protein [Acinetobacter baumannii]EKU5224337.1 hypothetical protein [Acinetobacter baumannii]EKU6961599.1 hypothetical protein [Acinetobacter baumannii]EKV1069095.1 hypothetical protein [Acinetobacter baumannii]EKV1111392.1 hypothetical protein [Acinetobacter baumannii]
MTDLDNERKAFEEAYLSVGGKQRDLELEDGEYTNSKSQLGWELWQIKAKVQAVPEGFKLVPVELYNFQANRLAEEEFKQNEKLFNMEHRGLSGTEVELRKLKWLQCKAESIKQNYRQLVKWASESGAEG